MGKPKSVFLDALERPPGEREAFLREHCPDATCCERVRALLEAHERDTNLFRGPLTPSVERLLPGRRVGPYRLVGQVRGGSIAAALESFLRGDPSGEGATETDPIPRRRSP